MTPRPALFAITATLLLGACVRGGATTGFPGAAPVRPATGVPERFAPASPAATPEDGSCQSPIRDPVTGLQLRFVRSVPGLGDYAVPEGSYGARAGELLRVDCRSGRAVGLVAR